MEWRLARCKVGRAWGKRVVKRAGHRIGPRFSTRTPDLPPSNLATSYIQRVEHVKIIFRICIRYTKATISNTFPSIVLLFGGGHSDGTDEAQLIMPATDFHVGPNGRYPTR